MRRFLLLALLFAAGLAPAHGIAGTLLESLSFDSPALGRPMRYSIYLPDGAGKDLPVLYLLHGLGGRETDWQEAGKIEATAERLIAEGALPPVAIVMPDGGDSWYVNSPRHGRFEDALIADLPAHVEHLHGVSADPAKRAIAGLSMGGYGALRLAFRHPERFRVVASLSGAIFPDLAKTSDVSRQQVEFFSGAFGEPFEPALFNRENFYREVPRLARLGQAPAIYLTVGDDDGFGLYEGNFALYIALRHAKVPVELRITDGDHTWPLWAEEIEEVLRFWGEALNGRPPS